MKRILILLLTVDLALSACAGAGPITSTVQPSEEAIPTPASSLMGSFVWQTDGLFGYRMLRPANWDSVNLVDYRGYASSGFRGQADRILLRAVNLQAHFKTATSPTGVNTTLYLFEINPSLDGWTEGVEQNWKSLDIEFTLLSTLSQAKLYSVRSSGSSAVQIVAYVVDENQPLAIDLTASGIYADMDRLRQDGILEDFSAMVGSVQAIPHDPINVEPPLE